MAVTSRGQSVQAEVLPEYLWHEQLHRRLCAERLIYIRVGFKPSYDRDLALEQIKAAFKSIGVISYTIWEMFGDADIFLRVWLPMTVTNNAALIKALGKSISGPHQPTFHPFQVDQFLLHHLWGEIEVDLVDAKRSIKPGHFSLLNSRIPIPRADLARYSKKGYLAKRPKAKLLKFFTVITQPDIFNNPSDYAAQVFEQGLIDLLRDSDIAKSLALYSGSGMGHYLVSGRIAPAKFELLSSAINDIINQMSARYAGVRTITWLSAFSEPIDSREEPDYTSPIEAGQNGAPTLLEILSEGESRRVEVKGSAFKALKPAIDNQERTSEHPAVIKALARAVLALLNTEGGYVVVGVLEEADFSLESVQKVFPQAAKLLDFIVVGLEHEYPSRKSYDGWVNRVRQKLAAEMQPSADSWLDYIQLDHDGGRCCAIRVATRPDEYFFSREQKFFIRSGNSTKELSPPEMTRYVTRNTRP